MEVSAVQKAKYNVKVKFVFSSSKTRGVCICGRIHYGKAHDLAIVAVFERISLVSVDVPQYKIFSGPLSWGGRARLARSTDHV